MSLVTNLADLSLILRTHMLEGKDKLLQIAL